MDVDYDFELKEVSRFDEKIDLFWDMVNPFYNFMVQRTKDYLNWRYCDPRGGNYRINQVENEGAVLGYNVVRINRKNTENSIGYVVDQVVIPSRYDVFEALTSSAVDYFDESKVNDSYVWMVSKHPFTKLFEKYGFIDVRSDRNLFYHIVTDDETVDKFVQSKPEQLHFHIGDVDAI